MTTIVRAIGICALALSLSACSLFESEADVESDTSWSGSFNGRTVDGSGSQTVKLGGGTQSKCVVVQKQTRQGYLRVSVNGHDKQETTAAFGVVSSCGS